MTAKNINFSTITMYNSRDYRFPYFLSIILMISELHLAGYWNFCEGSQFIFTAQMDCLNVITIFWKKQILYIPFC